MRVSRSIQWGSLNGMRKVETPEQMTDEYRSTLLKIVYALASTEFASVEQHQRWINQGPTAEARFLQAQVAREMTTMVGEEKFHASFGARRIKDLVRDARYQSQCQAGAADAQKTI